LNRTSRNLSPSLILKKAILISRCSRERSMRLGARRKSAAVTNATPKALKKERVKIFAASAVVIVEPAISGHQAPSLYQAL
jgi:hypothetical protein